MIKKVTEKYELSELEIAEIIQSHFEEKMDVNIELDNINLYQWNNEVLCEVERKLKL